MGTETPDAQPPNRDPAFLLLMGVIGVLLLLAVVLLVVVVVFYRPAG